MFCLHLNISEHLTFKISSERSTCLKWELKTAHLSLLCVIWREMAFVLAQAICKKRSNGLRLLHLPLERSEDPPPNQHFHLLCLPRLSDQCQTRELGFKALRHLVKKPSVTLTGSSERALIVKTYILLQNQLLMSWVPRLWWLCELLCGVAVVDLGVFIWSSGLCFLYESIFWELILWLCVGMQKGVLGNVSCRAYLQLVVPNARLIGKLLSGATPWRTVFIID